MGTKSSDTSPARCGGTTSASCPETGSRSSCRRTTSIEGGSPIGTSKEGAQLGARPGVAIPTMKRFLLLFPAVLLLAAAPSASARVIELGAGASAATPSCPGSTSDPCAAVVRMTGLQGRTAGGAKNPYYIRRDGYIVAFTVTLSKPTQDQIDFFNTNFGSPAEVRLS